MDSNGERQENSTRDVCNHGYGRHSAFSFGRGFLAQTMVPRDLCSDLFATVLISNVLFLRRKLRMLGPPTTEEGARVPPLTAEEGARVPRRRFSLYGSAAVFFAGTLYGLLMISQGDLPRPVLPLLLIPLFLAVYCLKVAG